MERRCGWFLDPRGGGRLSSTSRVLTLRRFHDSCGVPLSTSLKYSVILTVGMNSFLVSRVPRPRFTDWNSCYFATITRIVESQLATTRPLFQLDYLHARILSPSIADVLTRSLMLYTPPPLSSTSPSPSSFKSLPTSLLL